MTNERPENLIPKSGEIDKRFEHGLQLGSTSAHKLGALKEACDRLGIKVEVKTFSAESEVNAQPFGFDETYKGAFSRAKSAQSENPEAPAIGIENGIVPVGENFVDLAVVVVLTPDGQTMVGTSAGVEFPREAVETARERGFETTTAGDIIAETMGGSKTDPHSMLTHGNVSRKELLVEAIVSVLSRL